MKRILFCVLFCLFMFHAAQARANLVSGGVATGSIIAGGTSDQYFTGTAGQSILLSAAAGYNASIIVYKPDTTLWGSSLNRFTGSGPLPATGTFHVVIKGQFNTDSGAYSLYYVIGGGTVSGGLLTSGGTVNATQPVNGLTSYQFPGTTGQGIQINVGNSFATTNSTILVYNPDGSLWGSSSNRFINTLTQNGNYTVVVEGSATTDSGAYNLYYVKGEDAVSDGTLVNTNSRSGTLYLNGLKSYQLAGLNASTLTVTVTGAFTPTILVYNPNGSLWGYSASPFHATMGFTGLYTVVVEANAATSAGGAYTVTATVSPVPAAPPASTPSEVVSSADPGTFICPECQEAAKAAAAAAAGGASGVNPVNPSGNPFSQLFGYILQAFGFQSGNLAGNPVNFDVGYKQQVETDYSAGGLIFTRIYRSDSTWPSNTIGTLWRHNFARTFSIVGSAASVTDGTGATVQFTLSGSNWIPNVPSTTSTLAAITGGYAYTLADGTVEKYTSSSQLYRIEYFARRRAQSFL